MICAVKVLSKFKYKMMQMKTRFHMCILFISFYELLEKRRKNRADFYQKTMMMGINIANTKYDGAWGKKFCYWEQRVIVLPIFMYGLITRDYFGRLIL